MPKLWQLPRVNSSFHVSPHCQASGQVEQPNETVIKILKSNAASHHTEYNAKLLLAADGHQSRPDIQQHVLCLWMMMGSRWNSALHQHNTNTSNSKNLNDMEWQACYDKRHLSATDGWHGVILRLTHQPESTTRVHRCVTTTDEFSPLCTKLSSRRVKFIMFI